MARIKRDMCEGPLLGNIIWYTIPIMLTSLLQLLFNAADLVVVGRFCGSVSVAAVGATGALTNLIVNLFIGLSVGTGVTVAHALGAHDDKAVHRAVHTAMPTAIISGAILTVVGICFSKQMLVLMDTPENVLELSALYMKIYFGGMMFNMVYNYGASILRAAGDTKSPLIFLTFAGLLNVGLNIVFVTVIDMNVAGVALATTISQALSAVLVVLRLMKRTDSIRLRLKSMKIHPRTFFKIMKIGIPSGIQGSIFSISNVLIQSSVNSFGDVFMSGNAAAGNIEGFIYVIMNSFYQTALNFIGQNTGAGKPKRVRKIYFICLISVAVCGLLTGTLANIFGTQLLSIYITDSAQAIAYGMIRFSIVAQTYFLCGMMDVTTGALRGIGASIVPMLISIIGVCGIRIGWILTIFRMEQFHTPESLFVSYPISWAVTFAILLVAFLTLNGKLIKKKYK